MSEELKAIKYLKENKRRHWINGDRSRECLDIIENALKSNERKLDLITEILVDVSKGNYADINDAICEIREVL